MLRPNSGPGRLWRQTLCLGLLVFIEAIHPAGARVLRGASPAEPAEPNKAVAESDAHGRRTAWQLDFDHPLADLPGNLAALAGGARIENVGPTSTLFADQPEQNAALVLDGKGARVRVPDAEGTESLDFGLGDAITLEAWVRPDRLANEANVYIIGKGRTYEDKPLENQNYALRLRGVSGEARVSFLFATQTGKDGAPTYHRWTSDRGFAPDGQWHHVAVSYRFGTPASIAAVVDGEKSKGKWDMGGSTAAAPVVDNDALWIGSSRGGDPGNSFAGALDNVMIHRTLVNPEVLMARRRPIVKAPPFLEQAAPDRVTYTLHPGLSSHASWPVIAPKAEGVFTSSHMAFHRLPMRYISGGLRQPWRGPLLLRAFCRVRVGEGEVELLVRSPGLSRLWLDGEVVLSTPAHRLFPDAHQPFEVYQADNVWLHVPRPGDVEQRHAVQLSAGEHEFVLEQIVGAKNIRCETGDTTVAMRRGDELFTLLGPQPFEQPLTDAGWQAYHAQLENELAARDRQQLHETTAQEDSFWERRHAVARQALARLPMLQPPASTPHVSENNLVDRYLNRRVAAAQDQLSSDAVFLRRIYLDTLGVLPAAAQTQAFVEDSSADKRARMIDALLEDARWADHWTSYWQDVLAENPSILKPTLNNTGPFRWWIHDALSENKPLDRFVTELIRMEGDKLGGGAAGFAMASENDVPMAAKGHILAAAFLGVDMKCARCHDAPYHPWTQKELFGLAAMLENKPIKVPATSSVPKAFFERKQGASPISLSIFPGDEIQPYWPFADLNAAEPTSELLGRDNVGREKLAALITAGSNMRFAQVMANRLWERSMGWGLVGLLGDWYQQDARQPELLDFLARELISSGYDAKHVLRLIFNSRAYQRSSIDGQHLPLEQAMVAPWLRRMTAEQVVDSLHSLAGIPLETEEITFDPSSQQRDDAFLNLGVATRAWQLTSLSNERDRPSLSLPKAARVVECLEAFGWRGSRQEPVSHRETEANMVQPGVVANSAMSVRLSRLTDQSLLTQLALDARSPSEFVDSIFEQVLTRQPASEERATFVEQIAPGFESRIATLALPATQPSPHRGFVTWANHFDIRANQLMRDIEREVAAGPAATTRLTDDWRQRAEDAVWALINAPEFQFIP